MQTESAKYEVVLLGVGHTNAHVLRMWRTKPIHDAHLTCVSNYPTVTYSGMLPGVLAGQYPQERMEIDLVRLCAANKAHLMVDQVAGVDVSRQEILFSNRAPVRFDVLSIGIGSVPTQQGVELNSERILAIKPMQTFLVRLRQWLGRFMSSAAAKLRVAVVGGGAGGVEISFCLPSRIKQELGDTPVEWTLITGQQQVLPGMQPKTSALVRRLLEERGVRLSLGQRVTRILDGQITLEDGEELTADLIIWATSASPPPLLDPIPLPKDEQGFLLTRPTLQTVADAPIFVVGDTGTIQGNPTPKAGVYAVRQGPIVWKNLSRLLSGQPLVPYVPQKGFLKLLNTGDGKGIGDYLGFTFRGRWIWKLKNYIDSKFMDQYQDYNPGT